MNNRHLSGEHAVKRDEQAINARNAGIRKIKARCAQFSTIHL